MKSLIASLALLVAVALPAQASDTEALKEKAAELAEQTSETASELGNSLKAWGSQAWEHGKDAAGAAKEQLGGDDAEIGETLKGIGHSLLEGSKRAIDAAKEKADELSQKRKEEPADPELEGIAI